ncbi:MAG: hypothetical protein HRU38_17230 [Saccharospirillaceae bacterium]|nr:hypothetical protein [Pseudomonadales bacterium]NRB80381.1 hypothetical protein [Saccharospirillaceae bacterium]
MMMNNDRYYVIHSQNTKKYPMMSAEIEPELQFEYSKKFLDEKGNIKLINNRMECNLAPEKYRYEINLAEPIPIKPEFVDFHMYDCEQSVSGKFVKAFEGFSGIQFLQGTHGKVIEELKLDYYYIHYLYSIECMDIDKSNASVDSFGDIMTYQKLVLNYDILNNIPEEQRLIFWLREDPMTFIVHQKFVDVYNEAGLKGARFVPIEQYNEETAFM